VAVNPGQCDCHNSVGGGDCDGRLLLVLLVIFAAVGAIIILIAGIAHSTALVRRHISKIKRRSSVAEYMVASHSNALHIV